MMAPQPRIYGALKPVIATLDQLDVVYCVGGSVASSIHGIPRTTLDVDVVCDLKLSDVDPFVRFLEPTYYVSEDAVKSAVLHQGSFNLVHYDTMMKVDVFKLKRREFDLQAMQRRVYRPASGATADTHLYLSSPEDIILNKLEWYRMGEQVSERQWLDVVNVMKVQGELLDRGYLQQWAGDLNLADLLARALTEAGL